MSHPEVQAAVLAEARELTGYDTVVQQDAPKDNHGADGDARQGSGLAAEMYQQRRGQHYEVENPLGPAGDRRATEHARQQAEAVG